MPVDKKLVKPVCEQEEYESRKVWREVTVGLKINDMDKATANKCLIEQKQRDEARIRKENNIPWETKVTFLFIPLILNSGIHFLFVLIYFFFRLQYFKETNDGGWVYVAPLANRLRTTSDSVQ